jgi:hypothetical protein
MVYGLLCAPDDCPSRKKLRLRLDWAPPKKEREDER